MAVTPVRTALPSISVTYPTSTPGTSVMEFHRPGRPPNGIPSARPRGLPPGVVRCGSGVVMVTRVTIHGASSPDVPRGRAPVRHDVVCGPQAAGQRHTRAHRRVSVLSPAGGPGLADSATKVAQLGAGASHRVPVVPSPRGPGVEAACGGRRTAAGRTGVHLLRAQVRVDAAPGHPGQPLIAVCPAGAAAQAPGGARGDAVDPGFPGGARA